MAIDLQHGCVRKAILTILRGSDVGDKRKKHDATILEDPKSGQLRPGGLEGQATRAKGSNSTAWTDLRHGSHGITKIIEERSTDRDGKMM